VNGQTVNAAGRRVAVLGCGITPVPGGAAWTLIDFDEKLLRRRADPISPAMPVPGGGRRVGLFHDHGSFTALLAGSNP